jgi:hypothetical protein
MSEMIFADPYTSQKILSGVLKALNDGQPKRPNWLQSFYPAPSTTDRETVNFDQQFATRNVMGMFALPNADVDPVMLPTFGHKELSFSYAKEGFVSDGFEELNSRQLGEQFGQPNILANKALRWNLKAAQVEQRFENLFEKVAAEIMLYGGYGAVSEKYPLYVYDFGRTVGTTAAVFAQDLIPSVNLTTVAVTAPWNSAQVVLPVVPTSAPYTAGEKTWNKTNITAGTATPYKDVLKMVQTADEWDRATAIHMSQDAYEMFNFDIETHFKEAANTETLTLLQIQRDILPRLDTVDSLHFQRTINFGNGRILPIYTYKAVYHDRNTGERKRYIGEGWVNVIPSSGFVKIHGRIMHPKANWMAMPRWMNYWMNPKTGQEEWEFHSSFVMGNLNINGFVTWKVK